MKKRRIYSTHLKKMADLLTPVGMYSKLRDRFPHSLLLESADYHDRSDSKSFICLQPIGGFEAKGKTYRTWGPGEEDKSKEAANHRQVLDRFFAYIRQFKADDTGLPFDSTGLFGYTAYEAVQYMEDIALQNPAPPAKDNPDLLYRLYRFVLVFDHYKNELYLTHNSFEPGDYVRELESVYDMLQLGQASTFQFFPAGGEEANIPDEEYESFVSRGIAHCKRGDVFQLVLSRSFSRAFKGDEFNVYRTLRSINPSPYLFYFDYGDFKIFGSSPESQLTVWQGVASINPIAGTVKRTGDAARDEQRARDLKNNPKEKAEHVMLVDLARNDLSKQSGEVTVDSYAEIQYFSHVIHMVSKVSGRMTDASGGLEIFADTFPAGTLSGAPKYKAMQIIDETETESRNFYGGALGFIGFNGTINHAIIIRSILSKNNVLTYQAGAGIVAGSTPAGELQEVNNKVAALRTAIEKAKEL